MSITVLLIEPSEPDRYWMQLMLRETGIEYTLHEFPSAIAALEDLAAAPIGPVDVVIVNVVLPVLEIGDAIARLRALRDLRDSRYAVTVLDEHDAIRIPRGCGTLVKPVSAEALRRFLEM
jgi:CheY-like chemotaxis protein